MLTRLQLKKLKEKEELVIKISKDKLLLVKEDYIFQCPKCLPINGEHQETCTLFKENN